MIVDDVAIYNNFRADDAGGLVRRKIFVGVKIEWRTCVVSVVSVTLLAVSNKLFCVTVVVYQLLYLDLGGNMTKRVCTTVDRYYFVVHYSM